LLKAMRQVKPSTMREFFALANQHLRWELNDFARQLARRPPPAPLTGDVEAPGEASAEACSITQILEAIDRLPEDQREVFSLVHIQGLTHDETADVLGVATKTVQRRLHEAVTALAGELPQVVAGELGPGAAGKPPASGGSAGS
jgi:RNA polymerase sigma-70 factor (ECF subfamily)